MKKVRFLGAFVLLMGVAAIVRADDDQPTWVVTASNGTNNQLLVYNTSGALVQTVPTGGQGGVSGNAGGIAGQGSLLAVVNFGSQNVTIFARTGQGFRAAELVHTASKPVSVAFGHGHLYILGTTTVESHRVFGPVVLPTLDGMATLLKADGSAAQVGVLDKQLIISEKSNVIETMNLNNNGEVVGSPTLVQNIPANVDTPFGLITRGNNAYVTIAHADETALVRNGKVLTVTGSGTQHSPCWLALNGPFLFSANSPSKSISRYAVYGQKIVLDGDGAAKVDGSPTDLDSKDNLLAAIDANGAVSHLSVFNLDEDGNLTLRAAASINSPINGVVIVGASGSDD